MRSFKSKISWTVSLKYVCRRCREQIVRPCSKAMYKSISDLASNQALYRVIQYFLKSVLVMVRDETRDKNIASTSLSQFFEMSMISHLNFLNCIVKSVKEKIIGDACI